MKLIAMITQISATSQCEAFVAGVMAVLWLLIIGALHLVKPQLKPSAHTISEYAIKPKGWIMQTAFFCIASSCLSLALAIWAHVSNIGSVLFTIEGLAFVGAGIFVTDPISATRGTETRSGILHNAFSLIVIVLFPVAATVVGVSLGNNAAWASVHGWLPAFYLLTWVGLVGFIGSGRYSAKHPTKPVIGYFQRFMVLTFAVYLIVIAVWII